MKKEIMKTQDALNILNVSDLIINKDIVKTAYIACCARYHPDHNGQAGLEMMKLVNVAYGVLKKLLRTNFFNIFRNAPPRSSSKADSSKAESSKAESSKADSSKADSSKADSSYDFGAEIFNAMKYIFSLNAEGLIVELCGNWLWLTGETFVIKDKISAYRAEDMINKFRYCKGKKAWAFRPEEWASVNRKSWSMDQIREGHGSREFRKKQDD